MDTTYKADLPSGEAGEVEELSRRLQMRELALESLFRLIERLGTTLELDIVVKLLLMTVSGQLSLTQVACYLKNDNRASFDVAHSLGIGVGELPPSIDRASEKIRAMRKTQTIVSLVERLEIAAQSPADGREEEFVLKGFQYAFPLLEGAELLGVLFLSGRIDSKKFDDFNVEILHMISKVASMSIRNATLYQELLESKMEIEDFAKVKKEFLTHTSHELRTPLTILKSSVWSMEERGGNDGMLVEMAKNAIDRLNGMVEQVLALNEVGLGDSSLRVSRMDVSPVLESCLRERMMELSRMGVTFKLEKAGSVADVYIDPLKMTIVFKSLIDNAVSSVENGGNIYISISHRPAGPGDADGIELTRSSKQGPGSIEIDDGAGGRRGVGERKTGSNGYVVIRIRDDGVGIPDHEISRMIEPFNRASNSKKADVRGLGLGLSVSRKIVRAHGASLYCLSSEGKGAEFSIWLDAAGPGGDRTGVMEADE